MCEESYYTKCIKDPILHHILIMQLNTYYGTSPQKVIFDKNYLENTAKRVYETYRTK